MDDQEDRYDPRVRKIALYFDYTHEGIYFNVCYVVNTITGLTWEMIVDEM